MSLKLSSVKNFYSEKTDTGWQFIIMMEYFTNLSVNHYKYYGTEFTKQEVKDWMADFFWVLSCMGKQRNINWHDYRLTVRLDGKFKDNRQPDLHNFLKIVCDSVEDATFINDRLYAVECGVPEIGEPQLMITIKAEKL
jgi:Holliday junction resolvase RusA-like endonuclease